MGARRAAEQRGLGTNRHNADGEKEKRMKTFIIGGLAALAMGTVVPLGIANAGTSHCDTTANIFGHGYSTTCDSYGDDGSGNNTTWYCNNNNYCTSNDY